MFEVIYMKAEFEPWWMFEGWEEEVVSRHSFNHEIEAKVYLTELLQTFRKKFHHMNSKEDCFFAFWAEEEKVFCEGCDDDLQIFHGLLLFHNGMPLKKDKPQ